MVAPTLTTAGRLEGELSDPVTKQEAAGLLRISTGSVYASCRQFDAARILGDLEGMRRHIPCIHRGGTPQPNGTYKGGRYIIPRDAFIRWYTSAGLDGDLLDQLYGGDAA
jgi:hypothetical protein